jgi:hypothetical protein
MKLSSAQSWKFISPTNPVHERVARFFLAQHTKIVKNISIDKHNIRNGHQTYKHSPFQGPPKYSKVGHFSMHHLATLFHKDSFVAKADMEINWTSWPNLDFIVDQDTFLKNRSPGADMWWYFQNVECKNVDLIMKMSTLFSWVRCPSQVLSSVFMLCYLHMLVLIMIS